MAKAVEFSRTEVFNGRERARGYEGLGWDLFVHSIAVPLGRPVLSVQPEVVNRHRPHLMDAKSGGRKNSKLPD